MERLSPVTQPQDIVDSAGTSEGGTLTGEEVKLAKAMKQIRAADLPGTMGNHVVGPGQWACHPQTPVKRDPRLAARRQYTEQQPAKAEQSS
jgi:hypothetical protein